MIWFCKAAGALLLICFGVLCGTYSARRYRSRATRLGQMILLLTTIRQRLLFSMEPTAPLLRSACEAVLGETPGDVQAALCRPPLDREDCRILHGALSLLGRSDAETQCSQLEEAVSLLRIRRMRQVIH